MPQAIDPEALYEHQEHFKEKNYLSELLIDQFYAPMQTQENLESNLTAIRQAYRMAQMDEFFVAGFLNIHKFLDKYEENAAYRCPMVMNFPYTKEDFLSTDMPFREIAEQQDDFRQAQTRTRIQKQAEKSACGASRSSGRNMTNPAGGAGRGRGRKNGGVQDIPTWALCILTTGERRLVSEGDGAGAFNRVIDIECRPKKFIFETLDDFNEVIQTFPNHYGHAGRRFVDGLTEERVQRAQELFMAYQRDLLQGDRQAGNGGGNPPDGGQNGRRNHFSQREVDDGCRDHAVPEIPHNGFDG